MAGRAAAASEKRLRCGQRKVGYISSDDPLKDDTSGAVPETEQTPTDTYTFELDEATEFAARLTGYGPGYTNGKGKKGGDGRGRGQDATRELAWRIDERDGGGYAAATSVRDALCFTTKSGNVVSGDPGVYTIEVQHAYLGDEEDGTFRYQLELECEDPDALCTR